VGGRGVFSGFLHRFAFWGFTAAAAVRSGAPPVVRVHRAAAATDGFVVCRADDPDSGAPPAIRVRAGTASTHGFVVWRDAGPDAGTPEVGLDAMEVLVAVGDLQ
jgi:hypothetical protein